MGLRPAPRTSLRSSGAAACLFTFALVIGTQASQAADELGSGASSALGGQQVSSTYKDTSASVSDTADTPKEPSDKKGTKGSKAQKNEAASKVGARNKPAPEYRVSYESMCELAPGKGDCITFSEDVCPNGDPLIMRTVETTSGRVVATDSYCSREPEPDLPTGSPDEVAAVRAAVEQVRVIEVTTERFRSFPIAASETVSEPEGFSLRNGNAHMYAIPNPQTFDVDIYDEPVKIRATPRAYSWNYGDGQTKRTQIPGKPMPGHTFDQPTDTSHVYEETGDFQIRLSTSYRGEYSVDGGPWRPIPGTANVPSDPMPMSVWRTKKLLVDQNCAEDPNGPACDSPFLKEKSPSK